MVRWSCCRCGLLLALGALAGPAWGLPSLQIPNDLDKGSFSVEEPDQPEWPAQYQVLNRFNCGYTCHWEVPKIGLS
jgi:hypothetical protein